MSPGKKRDDSAAGAPSRNCPTSTSYVVWAWAIPPGSTVPTANTSTSNVSLRCVLISIPPTRRGGGRTARRAPPGTNVGPPPTAVNPRRVRAVPWNRDGGSIVTPVVPDTQWSGDPRRSRPRPGGASRSRRAITFGRGGAEVFDARGTCSTRPWRRRWSCRWWSPRTSARAGDHGPDPHRGPDQGPGRFHGRSGGDDAAAFDRLGLDVIPGDGLLLRPARAPASHGRAAARPGTASFAQAAGPAVRVAADGFSRRSGTGGRDRRARGDVPNDVAGDRRGVDAGRRSPIAGSSRQPALAEHDATGDAGDHEAVLRAPNGFRRRSDPPLRAGLTRPRSGITLRSSLLGSGGVRPRLGGPGLVDRPARRTICKAGRGRRGRSCCNTWP